jgi:molecular chaperone GrpE
MRNLFRRKRENMDEPLESETRETAVEENGPAGKLLRLQADFDNYRRRNAGLAEQARSEAQRSLLLDLLPVRDNLLRALEHSNEESAIRDGILQTLNQFDAVMNRYGVEEINADQGTPFNPAFHEAASVMAAEDNSAPNTIAQELLKGYIHKGTVLRPAQVQVFVSE